MIVTAAGVGAAAVTVAVFRLSRRRITTAAAVGRFPVGLDETALLMARGRAGGRRRILGLLELLHRHGRAVAAA